MPPLSRRIPLSTGLTYNVLEWNSSSEQTILLLHGFLDNAWSWEDLVNGGLQGKARLMAPDWRGHGDSDWIGPGGYYHFLDYVADLTALVATLPESPLSIVAHSMGANAASYFAGTFPDRVHSLVLIEGLAAPEGVLDPDRMRQWVTGWAEARARGTRLYPSLEEAAMRLQWSDPELNLDHAARLAERGLRREPDGRFRFKHDPLHTTRSPYPFDVGTAERFWASVRCPVLLVDGAASPLQLSQSERQRREAAFRNARRVVVDGTGHSPHRHRPAEVAGLVLNHLVTREAPATTGSRSDQAPPGTS